MAFPTFNFLEGDGWARNCPTRLSKGSDRLPMPTLCKGRESGLCDTPTAGDMGEDPADDDSELWPLLATPLSTLLLEDLLLLTLLLLLPLLLLLLNVLNGFLEKKNIISTGAAWHSGHRVRLQNRGYQVRIPPGCKA
jgi:hypothetical protein